MSANRDNVEWLGKATFSNDISTIKYLLKKGVDVNWTDHMLGDTPLHLASRHGSIIVVTLLIHHGADINKENMCKCTPLHYALSGYSSSKHNEDTAIFLIQNGADINKEDYTGRTPLYFASAGGHTEVVSMLLEKGTDINKMGNGYTPLGIAVLYKHHDIVKLLLENGADINKAGDNYIPLNIAVDFKHHDIVKILLEHYVDKYKQMYYFGTDPVPPTPTRNVKALKLLESVHSEVVTESRVLFVMQILSDKHSYYNVDTILELVQTLLLEGLYKG
jgi:ankyrin repeat protein